MKINLLGTKLQIKIWKKKKRNLLKNKFLKKYKVIKRLQHLHQISYPISHAEE